MVQKSNVIKNKQKETQIAVTSAFAIVDPDAPKIWILGLICGHTTRVNSPIRPQHGSCQYGCGNIDKT